MKNRSHKVPEIYNQKLQRRLLSSDAPPCGWDRNRLRMPESWIGKAISLRPDLVNRAGFDFILNLLEDDSEIKGVQSHQLVMVDRVSMALAEMQQTSSSAL